MTGDVQREHVLSIERALHPLWFVVSSMAVAPKILASHDYTHEQ